MVVVLPLDALGVGKRHLGQLVVGHDLLHLAGGELAAAELELEHVGPRNDAAGGARRAGGEVELADEAVHGQAPGVARQGCGGRLPRGGPLEPLPPVGGGGNGSLAPEADPGAAVGGALVRLVLAAVGAVGLHAAPTAVPVVVAVVGGVEPVQPLQVKVRVEQVLVAASAAVEVAAAPAGLHLGRRELVVSVAAAARRRREVPERDVAAGAPVRLARALLLRRGVDDGLHAHVPALQRRERLWRRRRQPRRPGQLGAALVGQELRHRQRHPQRLLHHRGVRVSVVHAAGERGLHADGRRSAAAVARNGMRGRVSLSGSRGRV